MTDYTLSGWFFAIEEDIIDIYRHWHPQSQEYAGGDALATALFMGWKAKEIILMDRRWHGGGARRVNIYHFELTRGDETLAMPVLGNPYVERVITELGLRVVQLSKHKFPLRFQASRRSTVRSANNNNNEAWV
ncbi:MAG TPA: hypothetical protein VHO69_08440 [Phototrophicaceae bacterium]|jgi:hypothetical protein|nr:hypothetical protein [Phototrophicaceae bacterium]